MLQNLFFTLFPIIITISIGYYASARGHFNDHDNQILVKLIMRYALPLSIFEGIWSTPRKIIIANIPLGFWLIVSIFGAYILLTLIHRWIFHTPLNIASLRSFSSTTPSVPFIGSALLPVLFGNQIAALTIGICALIINLLELPVVLVTLNGHDNTPFHKRIINTIKKPLVLSALLGFALALIGFQMPNQLAPTFTSLGKVASGLAMFSIGIVLATQKFKFSLPVIISVIGKNIFLPCIIWGLMILFNISSDITNPVILTLAIPTLTLPTTLAVNYKVNESEFASTQFVSTVFSLFTMATFVALLY